MHKYGVFIGRFQPFHNGHMEAVKYCLKRVQRLIVVVGSDSQAPTIKNPWTSADRIRMMSDAIEESLGLDDLKRIAFIRAKDYLYNDNLWLTALQGKVSQEVGIEEDIVLFGHQKDRSTFYLKLFPQWKFIGIPSMGEISATQIRHMHFKCDLLDLQALVPPSTARQLRHEQMGDCEEFDRLRREYQHILDYQSNWRGAPFPPTFVTVDAVVIRSGHVLVVRRGGRVGNGQVALPGGFLGQGERLVDGCLRELKEETGIKLHKNDLEKRIVRSHVFDHPERDLRGRTITHAYCIDLGAGDLPKVKGGDDAAKAWWMPLRDLCEDDFYGDHFHIINYFVSGF